MTILNDLKSVGPAWALISFAIWVLTGFGLFKLASQRGCKTPFLVFVPFLRDMIIGTMADGVVSQTGNDPFAQWSNFKIGGSYAKSGLIYSLFFALLSSVLGVIKFLKNNLVPLIGVVECVILVAISYIVIKEYIENSALITVIIAALGGGSAVWILAYIGYKGLDPIVSSGYTSRPHQDFVQQSFDQQNQQFDSFGYNQSQMGYGQPQQGGFGQSQMGGYGQSQMGGFGQPQQSGFGQQGAMPPMPPMPPMPGQGNQNNYNGF